MKNLTKGLCLSTAVFAAGAMLSTSAMAEPVFTVDESSIPNAVANTVVADKINGTYEENVEFLSPTNFAVSIGINFNNYTLFGAPIAAPGSQLVASGSTLSANAYSLYATFLGQGTYAATGAGSTQFTFTSGTYELWVDEGANTTMTASADGTTPFILGGTTADDYKIAAGTVLSGGGLLSCDGNGINCGSFGTNLDVMLTDPEGLAFFSDPSPFYDLAFTSGDFQQFDPALGGVQQVDGLIALSFQKVPEPATLALFGLGLAGMAGVARRKTKQA